MVHIYTINLKTAGSLGLRYLNMTTYDLLLLFMSVLSQTLFAFVSGHLMSFSFFTAWHGLLFLV